MPKKFLVLGYEFRLNRNDFKGPVIASADAFYFVVTQYGLADGGVFGALNAHTGAKAASTNYTTDLSELPAEVLRDPEWPYRKESGTVIVLPRSAVVRVRIPWFWLNNRVYVATEDLEIGAVYGLFRRGKVRRFLADTGWLEFDTCAGPPTR